MASRKLEDLERATEASARLFLQQAEQEGIHLLVTSTYRSFEEQQALYDQGRSKPGRVVTHARPGSSYHNVRRALDVAIHHPDNGTIDWNWMASKAAFPYWRRLKELAELQGFCWGGDWKNPDRPHYENDYCPDCRIHVGPRGASHFDEYGNCKGAGR